MPHSILLQGPPGSGKTTMAALTAVNKPVYFIDFDRKLDTAAHIIPAIQAGEVTYDEIAEALVEEDMKMRIKRLVKNEKPVKEPRGWYMFAELADKLEKNEKFLKAGTVVLDSMTRAAAHLDRLITYTDDKGTSTFSQRNWGSFLKMWQETVTILIDTAKAHGKDIIFIVHERVSEIPGPNTKVTYDDNNNRHFIGTLNMRVAASIPGQFGIEIGSYFEEVYGLGVVFDGGKPKWVCNVLPDGKRDLRTSHAVTTGEHPCDFRVIWGKTPRKEEPRKS